MAAVHGDVHSHGHDDHHPRLPLEELRDLAVADREHRRAARRHDVERLVLVAGAATLVEVVAQGLALHAQHGNEQLARLQELAVGGELGVPRAG